MKFKNIALLLVASLFATMAFAHTNTSIISRSKLVYPDLGYQGGTSLYNTMNAVMTKLGDNSNSRFQAYTGIANSTTSTIDHNFGVAFDQFKVLIFTGTGADLTRVADPVVSGWTIVATPSFLKTRVNVTTPASGGPHDFAVVIVQGSGVEKINDLLDVDTVTAPPENGQALVWDGSNFIPGASGDSSFKFQSIVGTDLTIKSGFIILSDGTELRLAADTVLDLSSITVDGDYYGYINRAVLAPSAKVLGRNVITVTASDFAFSTTDPTDIDKGQYVPVGLIRRVSGTLQDIQTLAVRRHDLPVGTDGQTIQTTATLLDASMPLTHGRQSIPTMILKVKNALDKWEQVDAGSYFVSTATEIEQFRTLATDYPGATEVILQYGTGDISEFITSIWETRVLISNHVLTRNDRVFANSSGGTFTLTLPGSPALGDTVSVIDHNGSWSSTNKVTLNGNGKNIMTYASIDLTTANDSVTLVFNGTEWRF